MRKVATSILVFWLCGFVASRAAAADGSLQDQFEAKTIAKSAERITHFQNTERGKWMKELENAFPGKVADATQKEDYLKWFDLLTESGEEWRRTAAPNPRIAALFDKVVDKLELGPVPTIQSQEFTRYVEKELIRDARRAQERLPDSKEEADKIFRVLDGNGDGVLERDEMTTKLKGERDRADTDLNGRIDKEEYRLYFQYRVQVSVETAAKSDDKSARNADSKSTKLQTESELPKWFAELDLDTDKQVALHEWRKAGRSLDAFMEMDLNDDGLLTSDEYIRFAAAKEKAKAIDPPTGNKKVSK